MEIVITEWALDSYIQLLSIKAFTKAEYRETIRPDVKRLKIFPNDTKFNSNNFWSPASDHQTGHNIPDGFKMKWHNMGPGKVQLRLPVGILKDAVLFEAYVKKNSKQEKRMLARFKTHLQLVRLGRFTERGRLP
jgi:hypothetical protein